MKIALQVLLALCLLAVGTCTGMMISRRDSAPAAPVSAASTLSTAASLTTADAASSPKAATLPADRGVQPGMPTGKSPKPLLWKVSDADNEVYLLGSFHALKPGDYPVAPAIDAAFDDAELVAFEVPPDEMNSEALGMQMMQAAMQPEGGSLEHAVDPATWARVQAYCQSRGTPIEGFQMLEPWFVALVISLGEMGRVGYDPKQGLDQQMIVRASAAHKRTMGLETGASQIAVLDGMSKVEQQQSLVEALDDADDQHSLDELHDEWRRGDADALENKLTVEFKGAYGSLYQRINVDRNQAWIPQIQKLLDDSHSDDALVVVGTMHLLGPDGLVRQLQSKGYRVERL
jgi:uncharacterized protein YbaP (TraB family)